MKAILNSLLACLVLGLFPLTASAQDSTSCGRHVHVAGFFGTAFLGQRYDDLIEEPVYFSNGTRDESQSYYTTTTTVRWEGPGVGTGALVGLWPCEGLGFGVGMQMYWLIDRDGVERPHPGVTLHLGGSGAHLYLGWVQTSADIVALPGNATSAYLKPGLTRDDFLRRDAILLGRFLIGFKLAGVNFDGREK